MLEDFVGAKLGERKWPWEWVPVTPSGRDLAQIHHTQRIWPSRLPGGTHKGCSHYCSCVGTEWNSLSSRAPIPHACFLRHGLNLEIFTWQSHAGMSGAHHSDLLSVILVWPLCVCVWLAFLVGFHVALASNELEKSLGLLLLPPLPPEYWDYRHIVIPAICVF